MKYKNSFFVLVLASVFLISGHNTESTAQNNADNPSELIMRFNAEYNGSIGWGDVYKCRVNEVFKGGMEDSVINLYIIVNNYDSIFHRKPVQTGKKTVKTEFDLVAGFKEIENDKTYVNFKNAFIDNKKRTWEITYLKSADNQ